MESENGARAPWSSVLQKKINPQILVSKILKKIMVVNNIVIHHSENFQDQTLIIPSYAKITNLARYQNFEIVHYSTIQICTFLFFGGTVTPVVPPLSSFEATVGRTASAHHAAWRAVVATSPTKDPVGARLP